LDKSEQEKPAESGPARPKSAWADMFLSGPDDQEEPEPGAPEPGVPGPGAPGPS